MIVYGDHVRHEDARAKLNSIDDLLRQGSLLGPGLERHGLLVAALIEAGELAQGFADAAFAQSGEDEPDRLDTALMALTTRLASVVERSWDSGFTTFGPIPTPANLAAIGLSPATLTIRAPEGFGHYAVYPEAYRQAALGLGSRPNARVIGIRSIGTTLAAMVAAALDAKPPVTVRPTGHPFARHLSVGPALREAWTHGRQTLHAVVDEGPGLSGSSFGAVADALEAQGVSASDLVFFPSHDGDPGREASADHRRRWAGTRRLVLPFEALTGPRARPAQRFENWAADLIGPSIEPPKNLSGGTWRPVLLPRTHTWPPVDAQNEKLKFLFKTGRGTFLLRFIGLGTQGLRKHDMAQRLGAANFCIMPLGWRHGFLVEPWRDDALPLGQEGAARERMPHRLAGYLAFRAALFPAVPESGASLEALFEMARANTAEALGEDAARRLTRWVRLLPQLAPGLRRIAIDGRLQPWEWLETSNGQILKTDALDHHAAHDLVGCQPLEWDIAGAIAEWGLTDGEAAYLCGQLGGVNEMLLGFFRVAYGAFQAGAARMALDRAVESEQPRLAARFEQCRAMLAAALDEK